MKINKFQKVKITLIEDDLAPESMVTVDADGLLKRSPMTVISRNIDGGAATTVYLATQKVDGGNATN